MCARSFLRYLYGTVYAVSPIKLIVCYRTDAFTVWLKLANRNINYRAGFGMCGIRQGMCTALHQQIVHLAFAKLTTRYITQNLNKNYFKIKFKVKHLFVCETIVWQSAGLYLNNVCQRSRFIL